jgi:hypothetical protein
MTSLPEPSANETSPVLYLESTANPGQALTRAPAAAVLDLADLAAEPEIG